MRRCVYEIRLSKPLSTLTTKYILRNWRRRTIMTTPNVASKRGIKGKAGAALIALSIAEKRNGDAFQISVAKELLEDIKRDIDLI